MSSLGNKLDYTIVTKALIKQALQGKGQAITDEDTFRDYVEMIGNITDINPQSKVVTPTTEEQVIEPDELYNALDEVTVRAVTSDIDNNIQAGNIKSGITVLGVTGTVIELQGETKVVAPTTSQQVITPTVGKNAITELTVNAVTSAIDSNITSANIRSGVTVLGVEGGLVEKVSQDKSVYPSTTQQVVLPSSGYNSLGQVIIYPVDDTIDGNIVAENIKDGVTILGVTGTYGGNATELLQQSY